MHDVYNPNQTVAYSDDRAELLLVSMKGEVVYTIPLAAGPHKLSTYAALATDGHTLAVKGGVVVGPVGARAKAVRRSELEVGANPDFKPSSADRERRKLERLLHRAEATEKRLQKRERALRKMGEAQGPETQFKSEKKRNADKAKKKAAEQEALVTEQETEQMADDAQDDALE